MFSVGVNNVAVEAYLYSRSDPEAAERFFDQTEQHYTSVVERMMQGDIRPPATAMMALQLTMLHFRNARYDIQDFGERIEAIEYNTERFLNERLLCGTNPPTLEDAAEKIE